MTTAPLEVAVGAVAPEAPEAPVAEVAAVAAASSSASSELSFLPFNLLVVIGIYCMLSSINNGSVPVIACSSPITSVAISSNGSALVVGSLLQFERSKTTLCAIRGASLDLRRRGVVVVLIGLIPTLLFSTSDGDGTCALMRSAGVGCDMEVTSIGRFGAVPGLSFRFLAWPAERPTALLLPPPFLLFPPLLLPPVFLLVFCPPSSPPPPPPPPPLTGAVVGRIGLMFDGRENGVTL